MPLKDIKKPNDTNKDNMDLRCSTVQYSMYTREITLKLCGEKIYDLNGINQLVDRRKNELKNDF